MGFSVPCIVLIFLCVGSAPGLAASLDALNNLDAPAPGSRMSPSPAQVIPPRQRPIAMQMPVSSAAAVSDEVPEMVNAGNPAALGQDAIPVENANANTDAIPVPMPGADENEGDNETDASVKRDKRLFFWKDPYYYYDYHYERPRYYNNYYSRPRYYHRPRYYRGHRPYFYYYWKW